MIKHSLPRTHAMPMGPKALGAPTPLPTPEPDFLFTGYTGLPGFLEAALVLTVMGAAAWAGIRTGMDSENTYLKAAGWVGGVGSALLGLLYLGGKSGIGSDIGLPAVRVTPS